MDLTAALLDAGVVPVITLARPEQGVPVAEALLAGGLTCAEITFRSDAAVAAIEAIRARVPAILVGAGTILTTAQADAAIGGVGYLRALAGPYPMVRYVPTGGITAANVATYLAVPAVVAVGGTAR